MRGDTFVRMAQESQSARRELESQLLRAIAAALRGADATIQRPQTPRPADPDLVFERHGERYVVELKVALVNRLEHLQALLAAATLQARRHADALGARALPMLGLERLSDRTLAELAKYMRSVVPEQDWAVIDRHGRRHFYGIQFQELNAVGQVHARAERASRTSFDLFTDLGQWMAKVLLAPCLPEQMLAAPRARVRNSRHLAVIAEVSAPTAARWVQHMRGEGFLEESDAGLRLVRLREFLDSWRRALARPRREVSVCFVLPSRSASDQLNHVVSRRIGESIAGLDPKKPVPNLGAIEWKRRPRVCLAMFEAATAHGAAFVRGAPSHVYLDSVSDDALHEFELERTRPLAPGQITAVEPRFSESTFRAAVVATRRNGSRVPVVDVLQTWLEIAGHPARGRELASEIERVVIGPRLLKDDRRGGAR